MAYLRKESWLFITPETAKDTKTVTVLWGCRAEGTADMWKNSLPMSLASLIISMRQSNCES